MRFKYLTATLLRNAAQYIDAAQNEEFMCHCVEGWRQDRSVQSWNEEAINRGAEFKQLWQEMNMQFAGNLLENEKNETEENGFVSAKWKDRNNQRVMFLLMLADAIAYKSNGGKKRKPVPPPMILPDPGMVFEHRGTIPDEYEARNAYGTFLVQRRTTDRGLPGEWQMIDPNGQVLHIEWSRAVLFGTFGCTYNNNNRPLHNR